MEATIDSQTQAWIWKTWLPDAPCFLPRGIDNSSGDIIFIPDDNWFGPLAGKNDRYLLWVL